MKKLLVSGCSMTHGSEVYNKFYHPNNIAGSYSQHLADRLGYELHNVALPAASNDYIFHSLVQELNRLDDVELVVVMWTIIGRFSWRANNRHYFFSSGGASSMSDILEFSTNQKLMNLKIINDCWFSGDSNFIVDHMAQAHKFFITDFFDSDEERNKLKNYKTALSAICDTKKIKLIQLTWDDISDVGSWGLDSRHPNLDEHKEIANLIYERYYDNKQQ